MTRPHGPDDFEAHQAAMARWMGYPDSEAMNAEHDELHAALARWLDAPSYALREASGDALTREERALASMEEDAVLHLQRYIRHANAGVPQ